MEHKSKQKWIYLVSILLMIIVVLGTNFIVAHKKKENFYSNYNAMNEDYKKVLFATGQNSTESEILLARYEDSWNEFYSKYKDNPIDDFKQDQLWNAELEEIDDYVNNARVSVDSNQLHQAHLELEEVRKKWQEIFTKNEVSIIGTYLTDFHDKMEVAIELDEDAYSKESLNIECLTLKESFDELKKIETTFGQDYQEKLSTLEANLNSFCQTQSYDEHSNKGSDLKKSFISIYLKYG